MTNRWLEIRVRYDLETHLNLARACTGSLVRISIITSFGRLGIGTVGSSIMFVDCLDWNHVRRDNIPVTINFNLTFPIN